MYHSVSIYLLLLICIFLPISNVSSSYNCTFHHTDNNQGEITQIITVNRADDCRCVDFGQECKNGLILPAWPIYPPNEPLTLTSKIVRGTVYLFTMLYAFLGVSILADKFMAAIETITSQEKRVRVKKAEKVDGGKIFVTVRIWNETVSNLTLMALGSSAPEILLSVIESAGHNFKAGDLGPNTIVGSAAFNLFVIIAICVLVIPTPQVRRQQNLSVFLVTSTWSIFAYVWLYLIIAVISPGRIEIWEASELQDPEKTQFLDTVTRQDPDVRAYEENRRIFMETFQRIRKEHPDADIQTLERMTEYEMMKNAKKSFAFH
uniref:Sodium/calcium exchanger membrane region domain-containing protein n=1 Tax=Romanomermis culicivorax TaxID=13658 RepID=A0A915J4K9_ROMCU